MPALFDGKEVTLGGWCSIPGTFSAELMGRSGFDWVCLDMQHGLIGYDQLVPMLQAVSATGTTPIVRVPWNAPDHIMKALDAGASGIIVPMINSAEEAKRAVDWAKYPPHGSRSWGPTRASLVLSGYRADRANAATHLIAMIETPDGVRNQDEIMQVEGVDAIYVGPSDLALGHGLEPGGGVPEGSEHERLVLTILEGCKRNGVLPGIHTDGPKTAQRWIDAGYKMLTIGTDGAMLRAEATSRLRALRGDDAATPKAGQYA
ncbi:MAG: aldolase/citrate lyase family protein [Candidatus Dormiibacterota bacterium]